MTDLRVVFAGTPDFAVPCLTAVLRSGHDLVGVYTQPDRPAGRGRQLMPTPVKAVALAAGIPVLQPQSLKTPEARAALAQLEPDLLVVVAYGLILPRSILAIPRLGCWNVHASLLPRWRGAAPIQRAILAGDTETGVCLMKMEAGLDTGPVLLSLKQDIAPDETTGTLHQKLARLGAQVLADGLALARSGVRIPPEPQPEAGVSYAHKLEKGEARLDLARPALELERAVRAFHPWPVAELELQGERLRVHRAVALEEDAGAEPGTLLRASRRGLDLATGKGVLRLLSVQREGGKPVASADYLNARRDLALLG